MPHILFAAATQSRDLSIGKTEPFGCAQRKRLRPNIGFGSYQSSKILQKPGIDAGKLLNARNAKAGEQGVTDEKDSVPRRIHQLTFDLFDVPSAILQSRLAIFAVSAKSESSNFQRPNRFLKCFFKRSTDRHRLANALHLSRQRGIGLREFFERETRDLDDAIIDHRFKAGRSFAGDIVADFIQRITDGELGRDLSDRKPGGLGCESGRAGNPRVHFNHDHSSVFWIHGKLYIRTSSLDADFADYRKGSVSHQLVLAISQRLRWSHRDRIPGVNAHRIKILD